MSICGVMDIGIFIRSYDTTSYDSLELSSTFQKLSDAQGHIIKVNLFAEVNG